MSKKQLRIDIVSDVVCPWCAVGYKRLEKALKLTKDDIEADIHWHPFFLNRDLPDGGRNYSELLMEKYGMSAAQLQANRARLVEAGAELGFTFNYYDDMKTYNTFKAHQLLQYASEHDKKQALKLRLMTAYFSEQKNINDIDTLAAEAVAIGLDETESRAVLIDGRYADAVRAEEHEWVSKGVQSVPTYIFNETQGIAGAHEPASLAQVMREIVNQS